MGASGVRVKTFSGLCTELNKPPKFLRHLQSKLGIPVADNGDGYSAGYVAFLRKVLVLGTFDISMTDVRELLETEKKLLTLLRIDSLSESPTWYLDACSYLITSPDHLFLTNHGIGHSLSATGVQFHLDFAARQPELFRGVEMGEDVRRVMELYFQQRDALLEHLRVHAASLEDALTWHDAVAACLRGSEGPRPGPRTMRRS